MFRNQVGQKRPIVCDDRHSNFYVCCVGICRRPRRS